MHTDYPHHLPTFDYIGEHRYFLTFCCDQRAQRFVDDDAVSVVAAQFLRAAEREAFSIIACCFMPDHARLIVQGLEEDSDLKQFQARAKQLSAYHYKERYRHRLWQRYGYERALREEESTRTVVAYVLENPVRARLVETVREYPHLMSSLYDREALIEFAYFSDGSG
jgi:REP element-mobilizing transposase RayT